MAQRGVRRLIKRAVDVGVAGTALAAGAPVLGATAAAIAIRMGRPVLFTQERVGKDDEVFVIYKFRTMRDAVGADGQPLPDEDRLTRLGQFLRKSSIDELPQLLNVLKGDMSLVGPRPLLVRYLSRYNTEQRRRHEVLPGITGWTQVNGRNALSWTEKFEHDVWYVDHWSLGLDARILALTLRKVLARADISAEGHATMPEFVGEESG